MKEISSILNNEDEISSILNNEDFILILEIGIRKINSYIPNNLIFRVSEIRDYKKHEEK